jgi:hypothetical protein
LGHRSGFASKATAADEGAAATAIEAMKLDPLCDRLCVAQISVSGGSTGVTPNSAALASSCGRLPLLNRVAGDTRELRAKRHDPAVADNTADRSNAMVTSHGNCRSGYYQGGTALKWPTDR